MAKYYEFRLLPDFAGSSISKSITDAYMNVHYWDEFQFEAGKFKQPFSYEQLIQDRYVPTMERSMMDQLVPQRDEGVMIHGHKLFGDRFDNAAAVSNGDPNDSTIDNNQHKDFNGRIASARSMIRRLGICSRLAVRGIRRRGRRERAVSTASSSPPIITTPATVTWFAYNTGVLANGVRDRISPELVYFYHSFGFAAQYYQEDQVLQSTAKNPPGQRALHGLLRLGNLSPDGRATDRLQPADRSHPSLRPTAPIGLAGGLGSGLPSRPDGSRPSRHSHAGLASDTGTTNRSSTEAIETTAGHQLVFEQVGPGATQLGTCQLCQPRADRQRGECLYPRGCVVHAVPGHLLMIAAAMKYDVDQDADGVADERWKVHASLRNA